MKEITAVIRMNMVNKTSHALQAQGFPCFTCRKVLGRGKKNIDFIMAYQNILSKKPVTKSEIEDVSEFHRLVPKRMFTMIVNDEDVQEIVDTIMNVNRTENPGDGKIFVRDVLDVIRIRTGESGELAL